MNILIVFLGSGVDTSIFQENNQISNFKVGDTDGYFQLQFNKMFNFDDKPFRFNIDYELKVMPHLELRVT